jgi:vacuolar protein sorting-associated protein 16
MGSDVCDLIQKVPGNKKAFELIFHYSRFRIASLVSIFRPGSTSPSAILFDAWESYSQRSAKADESVRSIRPDLAAAVDECIDAAGREWEPSWQRRLLNVGA